MDKRNVNIRQFLCVVPICCQFFMVGISRGWIAPILSEANDPHSELPLTTEQSSWMASLNYLTRIFSPFFLLCLGNRVGRSSFIVFSAIVNFAVWIVVYWSRDVLVHYALRSVCGLSDGLLDAIGGIYVCENCYPRIRGTLFTVAIMSLFAAYFCVFVLAEILGSYSAVAVVNGLLGLIALASSLLLVEPPQYYLMRGEDAKAKRNFARLRDMDDPAAVKEFEAMKKNVEEEKSRTFDWALYRSKEVLRSLRLLIMILSLCMGAGWPAVASFLTKIFSNSRTLSPNQFSMLNGMVQFVSAGVSSIIMDKFGRRTLLLMSGACVIVIHVGIALLNRAQYVYEIPYFDAILFILITAFTCVGSMFVFPLMGILRGELLPQSVKTVGTSLITMVLAVVSFFVARTFLPIAETFGLEFNFITYSCFALILVVYTYFDLPETRGKTLVEIQDMLKGIDTNILESSHL